MKKKALFSGLLSVMAASLVCSCDDTFNPAGSDGRQGNLQLSLKLDKDVAAPKPASRGDFQSSATAISEADLALRLSATEGSFVKTWDSPDQLEASNEVPVGQYLFEAYYGDAETEGFDKPYFYGSQDITVLENRYTNIDMTVALANAMVTVVYSDAVKDYFDSFKGTVTTSLGNDFEYAANENRPLYVAPGSIAVSVDVTKQNGVSGSLETCRFNAEPRHHYRVTFDVNGGETGKGQLAVTFSSALDEEEMEFDLSDEILIAPAPTIQPTGFESGTALSFVEGLPSSSKLSATIVAHAGLSSVLMTTSSASLLAQGWPAEIDFAAADNATLAKLAELGLKYPGLTGAFSQMAVLDFTDVISHLAFVDGADNISEINIIAKDKASKVSEPVALKLELEKLALEIVDKGALLQDETQLEIILSFNGVDLEKNAKFEIANSRGTKDVVTPLSITPVSRAAQIYKVVLPVPAEGNVTYTITCGNLKIENIEVKRGVGITYNENDVFATHAAVKLVGDDANAATASVLISTDGVNFAQTAATATDATSLAFSNLTPATNYYVKAETEPGTFTKTISFTTEDATQLPNAGMESWSYDQMGDYQTKWYPSESSSSVWGTMNALTTSTYGKGSSIASYGGTAYRATSGTMPANGNIAKSPNATANSGNQHAGSNAALIRTVGWGSGNTSFNYTGKCEHITAGELFLGNTDAQYNAVRGISFSSRPASVSFYAKYIPFTSGNGDYGVAEIVIKDNSGNIIASSSKQIDELSSYTLITLPISYPKNANKAATMELNFKSSGNDACLTYDKKYISDAGRANYTSNEYVGSKLYIDDITLNY